MLISHFFVILFRLFLFFYIFIYVSFFPTTFMLWVSFSSVPECVEVGLLETSFSDPPAAPGTPLLLLLLLLCCTLVANLLVGSYSYFHLGPFFYLKPNYYYTTIFLLLNLLVGSYSYFPLGSFFSSGTQL